MFRKFRESAKELTITSSLTGAGMLLALNVVIGYYANFTLSILPSVKLSFSFIPKAISAALFGPIAASLVGGLGDIISYFMNPVGGGYFPGWTLNAMLGGIIYGLFLYKNGLKIKNILISKIIVAVFVDLLLGTLWLNLQFGFPYMVTLFSRGVKQLIIAPFEVLIILTILKALRHVPILRTIK